MPWISFPIRLPAAPIDCWSVRAARLLCRVWLDCRLLICEICCRSWLESVGFSGSWFCSCWIMRFMKSLLVRPVVPVVLGVVTEDCAVTGLMMLLAMIYLCQQGH